MKLEKKEETKIYQQSKKSKKTTPSKEKKTSLRKIKQIGKEKIIFKRLSNIRQAIKRNKIAASTNNKLLRFRNLPKKYRK